jgi:hypothetical protein
MYLEMVDADLLSRFPLAAIAIVPTVNLSSFR